MEKPLIALTMGDPAGVGPEIIAGIWPDPRVHALCRPIVIGDVHPIRRAIELRGVPVEVATVESPAEAAPDPTTLPCLNVMDPAWREPPDCERHAWGGEAAYRSLVAAARLALGGQVDAITTAPLHKAALHDAGHFYPGHTELLAELCGVRDFAMMLYLGPGDRVRGEAGLGVVHTTLHMGLAEVFAHLTTPEILRTIRLTARTFRAIKGGAPRIAVLALNPHAGEEGLFGNEETTLIRPAVEQAAAEGISVEGPIAADTAMVRAADGEFDAVVAMYHDQGHIALKLLGMHRAVNVTLGLPIVRTSVAHGTAFDRAWKGTAETSSLVEALRVAAALARDRRGSAR